MKVCFLTFPPSTFGLTGMVVLLGLLLQSQEGCQCNVAMEKQEQNSLPAKATEVPSLMVLA